MNNNENLFLFGLMLVLLSGCASQRVWMYRAEPYVKSKSLVNKTVAVLPLSDRRENINRNLIGLGMIPLMPFGWQDMQSPEGGQVHITSGIWLFRPPEDFAKAIAEELRNSGIFKEVFFTYKASEGDLVLKGQLKSTRYKGKMLTYCIAGLSPSLWLIGAPCASAQNELEIQLQLENPIDNQILWESSYKKMKSSMSWIYVMKPDFFYDELLKEIMKDAVKSLKANFAH